MAEFLKQWFAPEEPESAPATESPVIVNVNTTGTVSLSVVANEVEGIAIDVTEETNDVEDRAVAETRSLSLEDEVVATHDLAMHELPKDALAIEGTKQRSLDARTDLDLTETLATDDTSSTKSGSSPTSTMRGELASSPNTATITVGLVRSPTPSTLDKSGSGLVVNSQGIVTSLLKEGLALKWGQFKKGDRILSIGGKTFSPGTDLMDYLEEGRLSYLVDVARKVKRKTSSPDSTSFRALNAIGFTFSQPSQFTTEESLADALAKAGDYLRGIKRASADELALPMDSPAHGPTPPIDSPIVV